MNFKTFKIIILLIALFFLNVCSPKAPVNIEIGKEECAQCKMKIMDLKFNAQVLTSKGRIYHFDSIECLISWLNENRDTEIKNAWVKDYLTGEWIEYKNAIYFVSKDLPSPMGAYLSSFKNESSLQVVQKEKQGYILKYQELFDYIKSLKNKDPHEHNHKHQQEHHHHH